MAPVKPVTPVKPVSPVEPVNPVKPVSPVQKHAAVSFVASQIASTPYESALHMLDDMVQNGRFKRPCAHTR